MASLCHPWFTTSSLSYRFPIFETSATALCGTTGIPNGSNGSLQAAGEDSRHHSYRLERQDVSCWHCSETVRMCFGPGCIRQDSMDRQYLDTTAHLTDALLQAFQVIEDIFQLNPRSIVSLFPLLTPRLAGASDAVQEEGFGLGGFLLSDKHSVRRGAEVVITEDMLSLWRPQDVLMAQLELLMVFQALVTFPDAFRYATGVWYIDDIAALMSLVRGRSDNPDLERMAQIIRLALFHLQCGLCLWFEWVQSKSNWSGGISRFGLRDSFVIHHSFTCHRARVVTQLWQLPTFPLSKVFSYL